MYAGRVVERAPTRELFYDPQMPYTWGLLGSIPRLDRPKQERLHSITGAPPSLIQLPEGCKFRPRCPHAFEKCLQEPPLENRVETPGHLDRCWLDVETKRSVREADDPRRSAGGGVSTNGGGPLIEVRHVKKYFPIRKGLLQREVGAGARGRRRELRGAGGRDARPRRRVGLRQVDARPDDRAAARADGRRDHLPRAADRGPRRAASCGRCAGRCRSSSRTRTRRSTRASASADHRRPAQDPLDRRQGGAEGPGRGAARDGRASRRSTTTASRTSSRAASASGSASRGRSRSGRS